MVVVTCLNTMQWSISIHRITNMRMATHRINKIGWWKLCTLYIHAFLFWSPLCQPLLYALCSFCFSCQFCLCPATVISTSDQVRSNIVNFSFSLFLSGSGCLCISIYLSYTRQNLIDAQQRYLVQSYRTQAHTHTLKHIPHEQHIHATLWSLGWKTVPVRLAINILYK